MLRGFTYARAGDVIYISGTQAGDNDSDDDDGVGVCADGAGASGSKGGRGQAGTANDTYSVPRRQVSDLGVHRACLSGIHLCVAPPFQHGLLSLGFLLGIWSPDTDV